MQISQCAPVIKSGFYRSSAKIDRLIFCVDLGIYSLHIGLGRKFETSYTLTSKTIDTKIND